MTAYPNEPIWRHDINDQLELVADCRKVTEVLFQRLQYQGQHIELQQRMYNAMMYLQAAKSELEALLPYFPQEPQG